MKNFILIVLIIIFGTWAAKVKLKEENAINSLKLCENYCNSSGEDYSQVLQMSYGACICKNEEGENVAEGYHEFLNNKCEGHKK